MINSINLQTTPVGFEPTPLSIFGLQGRRLNHSAKVSCAQCGFSMVMRTSGECATVTLWTCSAAPSIGSNVVCPWSSQGSPLRKLDMCPIEGTQACHHTTTGPKWHIASAGHRPGHSDGSSASFHQAAMLPLPNGHGDQLFMRILAWVCVTLAKVRCPRLRSRFLGPFLPWPCNSAPFCDMACRHIL